MKFYSAFFTICLIVTSGSLTGVHGQDPTEVSNGPFRSPFRYVIVSNVTDTTGKAKKDWRRFVEVLLDPKAFSQDNLTQLFRLIAARFPQPRVLTVDLFTSLEDVETPEEREQTKASGEEDSGPPPGPNAVFIRSGRNIFFYIYGPGDYFHEVRLR
jgi:hypothetical protein